MLQMVTTGLAEEPGWRDFALPRLQARYTPLAASFVLGPLWALWHMPLFLTEWGGFPNTTPLHVASFIGFCIAFNVVMSWVFNRTNQSVPISMLLHVGVNNTVSVLVPVMFPTLTAGLSSFMLLVIASSMAVIIVVATRGWLGVPRAAEVPATPTVPTEVASARQ